MIKKLAFGLTAMMAVAGPANAATLFGVDGDNNLVRIRSSDASTVLSTAITGLGGGVSVLAMDIRVRDGKLYALTDDLRIVTINQTTGAASLFANVPTLTGREFAFDFNPTFNTMTGMTSNLRIVSNDDSNYVYNFALGALVPGTPVSYAAGGPASKDVVAAAYLNNDTLTSTGTTLYVIDSFNQRLATQNPMSGVLTTVGNLNSTIPLSARASFDILTTAGGVNSAFAFSGNRLYSVNLGSGQTTLLGSSSRDLFALTAAIPEPATWGMMILGFGFIGGALRAQKRRWGTLATA